MKNGPSKGNGLIDSPVEMRLRVSASRLSVLNWVLWLNNAVESGWDWSWSLWQANANTVLQLRVLANVTSAKSSSCKMWPVNEKIQAVGEKGSQGVATAAVAATNSIAKWPQSCTHWLNLTWTRFTDSFSSSIDCRELLPLANNTMLSTFTENPRFHSLPSYPSCCKVALRLTSVVFAVPATKADTPSFPLSSPHSNT